MKRILLFTILFPVLALAQSQGQNYIKNTTYKIPTATSIANPAVDTAAVSITYYDGLGRPIQKRAYKQSDSGKDIVTPISYDGFGRQQQEFLPYVTQEPSIEYSAGAMDDQLSFYGSPDPNIAGNPNFEATANPYSEKLFENSPLNRIMKQAAPGDDWLMGNGKEIKFDYQANVANEVKKFSIQAIKDALCDIYTASITADGYYLANELYKTTTKDENWESGDEHTTQEFKDVEGKVILKRTFDNGALDTYYIYDIYGNLSYVLPPIATGTSPVILDGMCYRYQYDSRNRLVAKKLPGKQWEYIVYDAIDRPIITGPVFSPWGTPDSYGYMFTKYDAFGRVCYTGWFHPNNILAEQNAYCELLKQSYVQEYTNASPIEDIITIDGIEVAYSGVSNPPDLKLLTINYYDNYVFPHVPPMPTDILGQAVLANVKGLQTCAWTRVLTAPTDTAGNNSFTFYDSKSRPVNIYTENYLGGYTDAKTLYNFSGLPLRTETSHRMNATNTVVNVTESFDYTPQGKLLAHSHVVNNNLKELLAYNHYDELGNLILKNVGGTDVVNFEGLQKIDYRYNVRGWLTMINDITDLDDGDLFAFKINYNTVENTIDDLIKPLYNGNIAETFWLTDSDNVLRKYGYAYDTLNRLNTAIYQKPDQTVQVTNSYNESISYDKNGNIQTLERTGNFDSNEETNPIDNLTYSYNAAIPNQLVKVVDSSNDPNGFKDSVTNVGNDYAYDSNGNMIIDENKGIRAIEYNHLNLPTLIKFLGTTNIQYIYNAAGEKVRKIVSDTIATTTDYLDGFQYKNNVLQFFPTAEGYVNYTPGELANNYSYVYNYLDHLGNIRVSYSKDPATGLLKILEENHYYPFGLKHTSYNNNKSIFKVENLALKIKPVLQSEEVSYNYKYNGKEYQDELGLNLYDYGARNYDPALGRWMNIDPLAEKSRRFSPYVYAMNNPVFFVDPDGMMAIDNDDLNITGTQSQAATNELQKSVGSQITLNTSNTGAVSYTQNVAGPLTQEAAALTNVIDDHSVTVNVSAENSKTTSTGAEMVGGSYMGNTVTTDPLTHTSTAQTSQEINPSVLSSMSTYYGKPGADTLHEVTESYQGGKASLAAGVSSPPSSTAAGVQNYNNAHNAATPQSGPVYADYKDKNGNPSNVLYKSGTAEYSVQEGTRQPVIIQTYP